MKKGLFLKIVVIVSALLIVACEDPKPDAWENQWEADFTEKVEVPLVSILSNTVKGKWVYDYTNNQFFISRDNGKYDRYCGTIYKFRSTPCNQIVKDNKRYFHFPERKFCCKCCDGTHGCGIVKPDWFSSGKYVGEKSMKSHSTKYKQWDVKGLQSNIYGEITETKTPYRIFQDPLSDMYFDVDSYKTTITDPSVFDLPDDLDCEQSCGFFSICKAVQHLR